MKAESLNQVVREKLGLNSSGWMHEATRKEDGAKLYVKTTYNHATRGTNRAILVKGESFEKLLQVPRIGLNSQKWELSDYGREIREFGRD